MGAPGTCTRILAPAFPQTVLTYGAATPAAATAPGQITVDEMTDRYALHLVTAATKVYVHVTNGPTDALSRPAAGRTRRRAPRPPPRRGPRRPRRPPQRNRPLHDRVTLHPL